jgi:hypothetical protein
LTGRPTVARRLRRDESGVTLVELLVAAAMGVILFAAAASLMVSALRAQPQISERAQTISTARWIMERFTREIRNGERVDGAHATPSEVSFITYVRTPICGSGTELASTDDAEKCQVTYRCSASVCTRTEASPGTFTGTPRTIFKGFSNTDVFAYTPNATEANFIEVKLVFPNPSGRGDMTISDGASLRNAT